jgi:copper chaperone
MIAFQVNDMTCNHCVGAITKAVKAVDPAADLQIDLATHQVRIGASQVDAAVLAGAITEAGFTPEALAATATAPQASGCCGGCGGGGH